MNTYWLTISTPDGNLLHEQVLGLFVRGSEGDLAVLAGHTPFVTTIKPGECRVLLADETDRAGQTAGGILTVSAQGVTLLAGSFQWQ